MLTTVRRGTIIPAHRALPLTVFLTRNEAPMRSLLTSLVLSLLGFTGAMAADPPADLVLRNGKIVTLDARVPTAQALAARGGKVVVVGSDRDVTGLIGPQTRVIDLAGKFAMPGFIESHGHFLALGHSKMVLDLRHAHTWDDIVRQVADAAGKAPAGAWIVGRGWHQEKWAQKPDPNVDGYPVHDRLSAVTPRNPVVLTHASGHMCFANALAMRQAGVGPETKPPPGGEILRDDKGNPTGIFRETAQGLVERVHGVAERSRSRDEQQRDFLEAVRLAEEECLAKGITSFQDAGSSFADIDGFKLLANEGKLQLRLWVMVRDSNEALARRLASYRTIGAGDQHLTVRAIKRAIDGALGAHGAWLLEPYADLRTSSGLNTTSISSIQETARLALEHNFQLCVHAIGDRANRETLNIFEEALKTVPDGKARRWRVEHAQHLDPADIPRFAQLGVIASMQGVHCTSDAIYVLQRLGERRAREGAYVWRSLMQTGAVIANGTDAPVEDVDPLACYYASVTRKLPDGRTFFPEQKMSRAEALASYTVNAAYAAFEEDVKGTLTPGKLADVVVLSDDLLTVPDDRLPSVRVRYTIVGGKVLYEAKDPNAPATDHIPTGEGRGEWQVGSTKLEVFTYKPAGYKDGPLVIVFHGVLRNADTYRDSARKLGDTLGAVIVSPKFDDKRFPTAKYQFGGLLTPSREAAPPEEWTWALIPKLADKVRQLEGRPDMPYYLIGHSGGGQFLVRLAGFQATDAKRIVAANPGSHLWPTEELTFPYGYGGLPASLRSDEVLRRYLAQPLTIYLGTGDIIADQYFDKSERAMKQGASRYERGKTAFRKAEALAKSRGWPFHWRLVEADGIPHDGKRMFEHPQCLKAIAVEPG